MIERIRWPTLGAGGRVGGEMRRRRRRKRKEEEYEGKGE